MADPVDYEAIIEALRRGREEDRQALRIARLEIIQAQQAQRDAEAVAAQAATRDYKLLPYMMLLSYGGECMTLARKAQLAAQGGQGGDTSGDEPAEEPDDDPESDGFPHRPRLKALAPITVPANVDLHKETARTLDELWDLGDLGLRETDDNRANVLWSSELQRVVKIDFDHAYFVVPAKGGQMANGPANGAGPGKKRVLDDITAPEGASSEPGGKRVRAEADGEAVAIVEAWLGRAMPSVPRRPACHFAP
ncbi:hypothetical protein SPI_03727 [Niveomyces insectorum RCEF 264]|uniref:Uncharacterized protein n=1 Tax=Niveomyces insectorum RCEF 264 TaxID=1081102 RepID=A0A167WB24_9HYPO|nr:hypothetical protein SPI_03727 [Niveomyces insectorum RCEF 264]